MAWDGVPVDDAVEWTIVAHFLKTPDQPWLHTLVRSFRHYFTVSPATYQHEQARGGASARNWLDYLLHAARAWLTASRVGDTPPHFIAVFPPLAVCLGLIKRLTRSRAPIVAWSFNLSRAFGGWQARLARFALRDVDLFVVYSRREVVTYARMLGLPEDRFVFVPWTEELIPLTEAEDVSDPFVLAMGTANRDYATLAAAAARLGHRTVIVAGDRAVAGLTMPPNVEVRSGLTQAECNELSQRARLIVLPVDTRDTAAGQVTMRNAMMCGRAVIATDSAGTEDYIEDGVTGVLVPPRDVVAMTTAIDDLWNDAARRQAIGRAGLAWMLENGTEEVGGAKMAACLDRAALITRMAAVRA